MSPVSCEMESGGVAAVNVTSYICTLSWCGLYFLLLWDQWTHLEQFENKMSRNIRKRNFRYVRPAKIQISLLIRAVWSESSLSAFRIAQDAKFLHEDNEDADAQVDLSLHLAHMFEGVRGSFENRISLKPC